jgi:Ankyrin repeats (3 copies)/Ankyrin repeat
MKPNRDHARRLLQCLVVAIRPLRVEELAELIAFHFGDAEGLPKLNASWRWEDQEQALLSSCSSLITIVDNCHYRVVQFSHFSVKEFLTSLRLRDSSGDISDYYVDLESAHTILAQACLSLLLQLDGRAEKKSVRKSFPLAQYAAEHWASHARFENVSAHIQQAIEHLFDLDKPHFLAWLQLYDIDTQSYNGVFFLFADSSESQGGPLYYASLCGLHDLARHLIAKYPKQVNARGGYHITPLVAALSRGHFRTAELLHQHGADPSIKGSIEGTPLHSAAAYSGDFRLVKELLKYNADISARDGANDTPLHDASRNPTPNGPNIVRLLLVHGADVNARGYEGGTPLHAAAGKGHVKAARVLLKHGADVRVKDDMGRTPLQVVSREKMTRKNYDEMTRLLREYGAR